jgi:hypothetical protein
VSVSASGENLSYLWTSEAGTFADPTLAATTWTAPQETGVYTLKVTVTGGNNLSSWSGKAVGVEVALELSASADTVTVAHTTTLVAEAVGESVVYSWQVLRGGGTLTPVTPDTVAYRAPDTVPALPPQIQVLVADGSGNTRSALLELAVAPYVATDMPSYVSAGRCGDCHATLYTSWTGTRHAGAVATLEESDHAASYCFPCHTAGTRGLIAETDLDNGGFDDVPFAKLHGVQCENCHGPGSQHPAGGMSRLPASVDAAVCGDCHNGPHHPTYEEWQTAGHSQINGYPAGRTTCVKCHNGAYAHEYLDDPAGFDNPDSVEDMQPIACAVCHNMHGTDNVGNLRNAAATDVVLPDGSVIPEAGAGRLCMSCHNGRRTPEDVDEQVEEGDDHFGPHHSVQGDMLAGTGAYEAVAPGFEFRSSRHLQIEDGCVHCHTNPAVDEATGATFTGHTFQPTVKACQTCHGSVVSFEDVGASEDYDGNGAIEGTQLEIDGLMAQLYEAILDASSSPDNRAAIEADFEGSIGDAAISTRAQRAAAYNYFFVEFDQSRGVHNARYAVQLLQQSILALDPGALPVRARIALD